MPTSDTDALNPISLSGEVADAVVMGDYVACTVDVMCELQPDAGGDSVLIKQAELNHLIDLNVSGVLNERGKFK